MIIDMLMFIVIVFIVNLQPIVLVTEKPCHAVISGKTLSSDIVHNLAIVSCSPGRMDLHGSILKDGLSVAFSQITIPSSGIYLLPIKIPALDSNGNYQLKVEGSLIGTNLKFNYRQELEYNRRQAVIVVETNRAIYTARQTVKFRVLVLKKGLLPYNDAVEIYILDPHGLIMRRWLSVFANNGVISLEYILPKYVKEGYWKIQITLNDQIEEQTIKVENFFEPMFDVYVETPIYMTAGSKYYTGHVYGMKKTEEVIRANSTVSLSVKENDNTYRLLQTIHPIISEKDWLLELPIETKQGEEYKLEAALTDTLTGETEFGYSFTRIVTNEIKIRFLQPAGVLLYEPNFPFVTQISAEYSDERNLPEDLLNRTEVLVWIAYQEENSQNWKECDKTIIYPSVNWSHNYITPETEDSLDLFREIGVLNLLIIPPQGSIRLKIIAQLYLNGVEIAVGQQYCLIKQKTLIGGTRIKVSSSTYTPNIGEYAVFHIHVGHNLSKIYYITVNNGNCQTIGMLDAHEGSIASLALPLSRDIALPFLTLLVFSITTDGKLISDSLQLPLSILYSYEMELYLNRGKDFKGDIVEVIVSGDEGAYIGVSSRRNIAYRLHTDHIITMERVQEASVKFITEQKWMNRVTRVANNDILRKVKYFKTQNYAFDTDNTFQNAGLNLLTNVIHSDNLGWCNEREGIYPCFLDNNCYSLEQRCDGIQQCSDGTDEINCPQQHQEDYEYIFSRVSRTFLLFDTEDGDWGTIEIKKNDHEGPEYELITAPKMADKWYFNAFSVSTSHGFSAISEPVIYSTKREWTAVLSGPKQCHTGEQLGLILLMCNHDSTRVFVLVTLKSSPLYKFVQVANDGIVSSYNATLTSGERHLLVYIEGGRQKRIDIPIVPQVKESGPVTVTVVATTQAVYSVATHTVNVVAEGSEVRRQTSRLIDLRNRALEQIYFDIPIEETPIVPYEEWRRYVYGSPQASITVTGSLLGPFFPEGLSSKHCLQRDTTKGTDIVMLEFAVNIWTLHYRRFTSRVDRKEIKRSLELCNQLYANILSRMAPNGGFFNWDGTPSSVWLTAWVLRALRPAVYADWENILYLDTEVFDKSSQWLVDHQTVDGAFVERNMSINTPKCPSSTNNINVLLMTCEVLITLSEVVGLLSTERRNIVTNAIGKATIYLEYNLNTNSCLLDDPKHVAVLAYALHVSKGIVPEKLVNVLNMHKMTDQDGFTYWSNEKIPSPPVRLQYNRLVIGPRPYTTGLSNAVYATSYALLTILARSPFSPSNDLIVAWLSTIKMHLSGFISVTDTMVAYQALSEYANRVRLLDITNMKISMTTSSDSSFKQKFTVDNDTSRFYSLQLKRPWGIVEVKSQGQGLSLFQMTTSYRVDRQELTDQPPHTTFDLQIFQYYSSARNKSAITLEVCTKWLGSSESSGPATLEIDTPTGYFTTESRILHSIQSTQHPTLCDATVSATTSVFYFSHIEKELSCFNYTLRRVFPVANMTLHRKAIIYETNRRESFAEVILESIPLYILSICEVCGSYQCPYCPYYNTGSTLYSFAEILFFSVIVFHISKVFSVFHILYIQ